MTEDEVRGLIVSGGVPDAIAVSPSGEGASHLAGAGKRFGDVFKERMSYIVARQIEDIAYVTDASFLKRIYLALLRPHAPSGPSLQHSKNAALIMIPCVDAQKRHLIPGFLSSYPNQSEIYKTLALQIVQKTSPVEGILISKSVEALRADGYKLSLP